MLYKSFEKVYLGISDIASLVIRDADGARELRFGSDGDFGCILHWHD